MNVSSATVLTHELNDLKHLFCQPIILGFVAKTPSKITEVHEKSDKRKIFISS